MPFALVLSPVLVFLPVLAFSIPVLFRLLKPCAGAELTAEWYESFNASSYRCMQGLLATEDFEFLSRQPGYDPSLARNLRRDRLRIFRQYLNRLIVDFNRLHKLACLVIAQGSEDQSDLFSKLLALRTKFWVAVLQVELSYCACRLGMRPVAVDKLINQLEAMSVQLSYLPVSKSMLA